MEAASLRCEGELIRASFWLHCWLKNQRPFLTGCFLHGCSGISLSGKEAEGTRSWPIWFQSAFSAQASVLLPSTMTMWKQMSSLTIFPLFLLAWVGGSKCSLGSAPSELGMGCVYPGFTESETGGQTWESGLQQTSPVICVHTRVWEPPRNGVSIVAFAQIEVTFSKLWKPVGKLDPISVMVYFAIDASCSYEGDCLWTLFRLILLELLVLGKDQFCLPESRAWLNLVDCFLL